MHSSDHYSPDRAANYKAHHQRRLRNRLTNWREQQCLRRALTDAGRPSRLLDLPCGTGRFWTAAVSAGCETLIAADGSPAMLDEARGSAVNPRVPERLLETSAFAIDLPDNCVDAAVCLRFLHHLASAEDRRTVLKELIRVSRRHVIVSLWVDGNYAGNRRLRKPQRPAESGYGRRICRRRVEVAAEFESLGLNIIRHYDVWPAIYMWRFYLLELPA